MVKETWHYTWTEYIAALLKKADMEYNSAIFFIFLFVFLCVYFLLRSPRIKKRWILAGNLVFYLWSGWAAAGIVAVTAAATYWAAGRMEKVYRGFEEEKQELSPREQAVRLQAYKRKAKKYLLAALIFILGIWIFVKIGRLAGLMPVETLAEVIQRKGILVPLGISYYSLSAIGYILDVYWRKTKAEHNFLDLFTVMTYFPHIVQGPISKYETLLKQLKNLPAFQYERVCRGLQLMLWGYMKKMIVADRLVLYTSAVFDDPGNFAGVEVLLAVLLCVLQLYADFSGCMDLVRGISQAMGLELAENFRQPLFARDAQEFWARWHITLGAWSKEYIYLPIAMNPKFVRHMSRMKKSGKRWLSSFLKALAPLMAVWLFTGLWHGTGIDYLVWGLYWCVLMTGAKEAKPLFARLLRVLKIHTDRKAYRTFQALRTYLLFAIGRTFTVAGGLAGCGLLWRQMFAESRLWTLFDGSLYTYGLDQKDFYVAAAGVILMLFVDFLHERGVAIRDRIGSQKLLIRWAFYYGALFSLLILGIYGPGFDAASFVYGAF